tara:strand:+ start:214 stop:564 length:351 start_codon:yes stop_codon:yes gene_type:complete
MEGASPIGYSNRLIKDQIDRKGQTTKVKGMFVNPIQVNEIVVEHPEVSRAHLVVSQEKGEDVVSLSPQFVQADAILDQALSGSSQALWKIFSQIGIMTLVRIPKHGKAIDDVRTHE